MMALDVSSMYCSQSMLFCTRLSGYMIFIAVNGCQVTRRLQKPCFRTLVEGLQVILASYLGHVVVSDLNDDGIPVVVLASH